MASRQALRGVAQNRTGSSRPARRDFIEKLLPTLFENESVLAVDKPAGVDVGGGELGDKRGVIEILADVRRGRGAFHPVNRLSRYESGVLLLAKDPLTAKRLRAAVKRGGARFEYLAVCRGKMPRPRMAVGAPAPASPRQGKADRVAVRTKKGSAPPASASGKPPHVTHLQCVAEGPSRVLVRCRTGAATTHLLRAQLRSANLRLVGDTLHEHESRKPRPQGTLLHLSRLAIDESTGLPAVFASDAPAGVDEILEGARSLQRPLHAALVRRLPLLVQRDTDAHRLLIGSVEDLSGVSVERFADVLVVQVQEESRFPGKTIEAIHRWYGHMLGTRSTYVKKFVRRRGAVTDEIEHTHGSERPFAGEPVPEAITITERGLVFVIKPYDGFSVGLFLDQRDNRGWVRRHAAGKDVLNLFAYTCGFSVAAAAGGARSTVSVDISPRSLAWGRENFERNGLSLEHHAFFAADAFGFLRRAAKKERWFDMIVVDPPSFAHGRKRGERFSMTEDLAELVRAASSRLRAGGQMLVCTNYRRMSPRMLRERVRAGLAGRRSRILATPPLPLDFAVDPQYARSLLVEVE